MRPLWVFAAIIASSVSRISSEVGSAKSTIVTSLLRSVGMHSSGATMTSVRAREPVWNSAAVSRRRRTTAGSAGR